MKPDELMEPEGIEAYLKLFLTFRALPESKRSRTFMEISGYPHYENVSSNILAFYFDPAAEHGLKDLLVCAFLQMAGVKDLPPTCNIEVFREAVTESGKRIDLIVDSEAFTIGIENKIFHWLDNDLEQYAHKIEQRGQRKNIVIKAVLGLHPIPKTPILKGGFKSYTYTQLWQQVRTLLGLYIAMADSKWVAYLIDFMETTTNLAGQNMEIKKTDLFFIENNDLIEKLISERDAFLQRLNQKVSILCTMMSESSVADAFSQAPWVYSGNCVVLDFQFPISSETYSIAFDVYLNPTGWGLHLFGRNKKSKSFLLKLISQPSLRSSRAASATITNDRHIVQTWPLQTDLVELKDALCEYVGALVAAYDASKISAEAFSV